MTNVTKKIKNKHVLTNISYTFETGKIYGVFGRNGSGKTMLLRTLAGLLVPTEGEIFINDKQLYKDISFPPSVGIIIENMELLPQYDAKKNLQILSRIKKSASNKDIEEAIYKVDLHKSEKIKVKKYSLGMKQRLNIAQAIFEKPEILLLDEPTNAIDENGVNLVNKILLEERDKGTTIIIASHHREDISYLCDYTLKMINGELTNE